jgi:hypothetical protein
VERSPAPISLFAVKDYGNGNAGETETCLFLKSVLIGASPL